MSKGYLKASDDGVRFESSTYSNMSRGHLKEFESIETVLLREVLETLKSIDKKLDPYGLSRIKEVKEWEEK
jgi:hypothetical protein